VSDGVLLVDKPPRLTSADVVRALKRRHGLGSIGHLGTLDPMATGLLPLCLGSATKLAQFLAAGDKAYSGTIRLGIATDTLDITGKVVAEAPVPEIDAPGLEAVAQSFVGERLQRPPLFSAVKVGGTPLYKLARAGIAADPAPRTISVEHFTARPARGARNEIEFSVRCSKGTYVRVLADELGRALGTVATLAALKRTEFGEFRLAEAASLDDLLACDSAALPVLAPRRALRGFREIEVEPRLAWAIAAGQRDALQVLDPPREEDRFACAIAPNGELLAIVERIAYGWELRRVLMPEATELYRSRTPC